MPHLRADPDSASDRQLAHYRQTVETLSADHPDLPFLGDLEQELAAIAVQRRDRISRSRPANARRLDIVSRSGAGATDPGPGGG